MKKTTIWLVLAISLAGMSGTFFLSNAQAAQPVAGYILLQVEQHGEAWYVSPVTGRRYFLGSPIDAFLVMKKLAIGSRHAFLNNDGVFPSSAAGKIYLDVERNGEAYYIYPKDLKKYYLGRPADAFRLMQGLGRGITDAGLSAITIGQADDSLSSSGKIILLKVPFTSQAPFGDWSDLRQEDGCEEASALMAMKWVRGETLTKDEALKNITGVSDFLLKKYGEYRDVSAPDVVSWIFNDYYDYDKVSLMRVITVNDIKNELDKGHLVLAPMNGQALHNPHYKQPGPPSHMVVIRGYDPAKDEFITNDPGTKFGEGYRYDTGVLFNAIREYPTGNHGAIAKIEKVMIVVEK